MYPEHKVQYGMSIWEEVNALKRRLGGAWVSISHICQGLERGSLIGVTQARVRHLGYHIQMWKGRNHCGEQGPNAVRFKDMDRSP